MAIEEPIDEVEIAGAATPGADRQLAAYVRISARGESRHFLVADVDPLNSFLSVYLVEYSIERIADYSVDSLHSTRRERRYQALCYPWHNLFSPFM
jgi:hypothetical protein